MRGRRPLLSPYLLPHCRADTHLYLSDWDLKGKYSQLANMGSPAWWRPTSSRRTANSFAFSSHCHFSWLPDCVYSAARHFCWSLLVHNEWRLHSWTTWFEADEAECASMSLRTTFLPASWPSVRSWSVSLQGWPCGMYFTARAQPTKIWGWAQGDFLWNVWLFLQVKYVFGLWYGYPVTATRIVLTVKIFPSKLMALSCSYQGLCTNGNMSFAWFGWLLGFEASRVTSSCRWGTFRPVRGGTWVEDICDGGCVLSAAVGHAALCMLFEWTLMARAVRRPATDGCSSLWSVQDNYR